MYVENMPDIYSGMKKEISSYDENYYYAPMAQVQPLTVMHPLHVQNHINLAEVEEQIFNIYGKLFQHTLQSHNLFWSNLFACTTEDISCSSF